MTADDPFFSPTHRARPRPRRPRERLFEFVRADDAPMVCDLFNHGEFGWEVQILARGELVSARGGYGTREEAVHLGEQRTEGTGRVTVIVDDRLLTSSKPYTAPIVVRHT
jgi:hypothetical protein